MPRYLMKLVSRKRRDSEKEIIIESDQPILEALLKSKVNIDHTCGGSASCGTCRFYLLEGELSPPEELEQDVRIPKSFAQNERLSCQCYALSDILISLD